MTSVDLQAQSPIKSVVDVGIKSTLFHASYYTRPPQARHFSALPWTMISFPLGLYQPPQETHPRFIINAALDMPGILQTIATEEGELDSKVDRFQMSFRVFFGWRRQYVCSSVDLYRLKIGLQVVDDDF